MPPLPPVPDVIRADAHFHVGEDLNAMVRTFWGYSGGPPSAGDLNTIAAAYLVEAAAHLYPLMHSSVSVENFVLTDLNTVSGAVGTSGTGSVGTRAGTQLPVSTCVIANGHIARRYRGGKPRSYWPFGVVGDLADASTWSGGAVSAFQSGILAFIAGCIGQVGGTTTISDHANVSYHAGFTVVTSPTTGRARNVPKVRASPVIDVIDTTTVNAKPGNQRRRYQR